MSDSLVSVAIVAIVIAALIAFVLRSFLKSKQLQKNGVAALAQVVEIHQTGDSFNDVPMMSMTVRLEQAGEPTRNINLRELVDLGDMPRAGDRVYVVYDRTKPDRISYAGLATGVHMMVSGALPDGDTLSGLTPGELQDFMSIAPRLREGGKTGVAKVLSLVPGSGSRTRVELEVDSVVEKKRVVAAEQLMSGFSFKAGDRAYIYVDPTDPNVVALVPPYFAGGRKIARTDIRLDVLVLGPQLLREGKKAAATVTAAEQVTMNNNVLAARGMQKWRLRMHIVPEDGGAEYDAEQDISFTGRQIAERICKVGAQVPVRCDWNDPKTFTADVIALGYPDPYKVVLASLGDAHEKGETYRELQRW